MSSRVPVAPSLLACMAALPLLLSGCGGSGSSNSAASPSGEAGTTGIPSHAPKNPGASKGSATFTIEGPTTVPRTTWALVPWPEPTSPDGPQPAVGGCATPAGANQVAFTFIESNAASSEITVIVPAKPGSYKGSAAEGSPVHMVVNVLQHSIYDFDNGDTAITVNDDGHSGKFRIHGAWIVVGGPKVVPSRATPSATLEGTWECTPGV